MISIREAGRDARTAAFLARQYEAWLALYVSRHHATPCTWVTGGINAQGGIQLLPFQSVTIARNVA
jgi:hypothetical protein